MNLLSRAKKPPFFAFLVNKSKERTKEKFSYFSKNPQIPPFLSFTNKALALNFFLSTTIGVIYLKNT